MTQEDLDILLRDDVRRTITENITSDPVQVALCVKPYGALIATQVKYLQRAKTKLPSYYSSGCIIPPLAFEQSSSEETAATKSFAGDICIDLTCGLGADTAALSRRFRRVISIERDPVLARVAAYNFAKLGIGNVEIINSPAEEFIADYPGKADLIYADPARRGETGNKLFRLEECSPDMTALMPRLRNIAGQIAVKCSPLFDVDEGFRIFGENISVEVVSSHGECKEVVLHIPGQKRTEHPGKIRTTVAGYEPLWFDRKEEPTEKTITGEKRTNSGKTFTPPYNYLLIPDVVFYKARVTEQYMSPYGAFAASPAGFFFGNRIPDSFRGKAYGIREILPFQPKKLKTMLKASGTGRINILKKDFPQSTETIAKALGVKQGGSDYMAFTRIGTALYALFLKHD